jgi:OmpA-OmpF porin, OOP family
MRSLIFVLFIITVLSGNAQTEFSGLWQGILVKNGTTQAESHPFFLEIKAENAKISGRTREELYKTEFYAVGKHTGTTKGNELTFKHVVYTKKQGNSKISWCKLQATLTYNEATGYLQGTYTSSDCRQNAGKITLYRTKNKFTDDYSPIASHASRDILLKDLENGLASPEKRAVDRANFVFQPIYFDYDKAIIRAEYFDFLSGIVQVVNGHSDLRVKVTGNTDADGTDAYNDDLSKRRAQAIIDYFVKEGISADRIEIEFNGEKKPIDRNDTKEGKQRNRRVEFAFI